MERFLEIEAFNRIEERFKYLSPKFGEITIKNDSLLSGGSPSSEVLRIPIEFEKPFLSAPRVITGFNAADITVDGHFRFRIEATNITNSNMEILVYRWFTTIHEIKIFWIAFPGDGQ